MVTSTVYLALAFGPLVVDEQVGGIRFVVAFWLVFQVRLNLYVGGLLYRRFLKTSFYDFYEAAERAGLEEAFMSALRPVIGEMLYEQTLPRAGFRGLMNARQQVDSVAA